MARRKFNQYFRAGATGLVRETEGLVREADGAVAQADGDLGVNDGTRRDVVASDGQRNADGQLNGTKQTRSRAPLTRPQKTATTDRPASARKRLSGRVLIVVLVLAVASAAGLMAVRSSMFLYLLYVALSLLVGVVAASTLIWMLHAWRTPDSLTASRLEADGRKTAHSFSLIVPARHEEAVLETTLSRLIGSDHPDFEVLVVVGDDDPGTREVAERMAERHPERVRVVVDPSWPKSKPKALNAALPYCSATITGVFDAEDDVHPALLRRVDQCFQTTDADIVQAGVQLMNFRSSWFTVHNVLEYYFWFRSRLHVHARQGFIPLGGNTVFIRTPILRAVEGWADCLAEDCEIGVRLSALGARTAVFYEPELVTREECPPTVRAFIRQRTRWNQGYIQTLARGYWWRLPLRQRALGAYILASPYVMALAWLMIPAAIATAVAVKAPIEITLLSFLPLVPMLSMLVVETCGLGEFCRAYGERPSVRDYGRLVLGLLLYQGLLAYAAARAVIREARGARGWDKTAHLGLHLAQSASVAAQPVTATLISPQPRPTAYTPTQPHADDSHVAELDLGALREGPLGGLAKGSESRQRLETRPSDGNGNGRAHWTGSIDHLFGVIDQTPLWARLNSAVPGQVSPAPSGTSPGDRPTRPAGSRFGHARALLGGLPFGHERALLGRLAFGHASALLGRLAKSRADIAVQVPLLIGLGLVHVMNMLHWPEVQFDEGTYVSNAWAVGQRGELGFYTYTYGHPPLAWLLISLWTSVRGLFGPTTYSVDTARELMCVVSIVSFSLLYTLARRLDMNPLFAAGAVILFALSPLGLFFHRLVLLDNPATVWAIAAFVLALSPRRRLWSFAGSGACFAASVLSKETTFVMFPALLLAVIQNADRRTRRYCVTLFIAFFVLVGFFFPLYAILKGELLPGRGHVSLIGSDLYMLFARKATGSAFARNSLAHGIVAFWLSLDRWLLGAALLFSPLALARRTTRAIGLAFAIQVVVILRPGYLPGMYVTAMLPFAALIVAAGMQATWSFGTRCWVSTGQLRRRTMNPRAVVLLRRVAAAFSAAVIASMTVVGAIDVAPRWATAARAAITVRLDGPQRAAEQWLIHHIGHEQRLIVDDMFWIYLIEHGFDSHPARGGLNSRTVQGYWELDYDPAVQRYFPYGWREFNYVVSDNGMRVTAGLNPNTAQALQHSSLVAVFGSGGERIEVRAIIPTPITTGTSTATRILAYKVPASGTTSSLGLPKLAMPNTSPSLNQVAQQLGVSMDDIIAYTNRYPEDPDWWYYEGKHNYDDPLPQIELHYAR